MPLDFSDPSKTKEKSWCEKNTISDHRFASQKKKKKLIIKYEIFKFIITIYISIILFEYTHFQQKLIFSNRKYNI